MRTWLALLPVVAFACSSGDEGAGPSAALDAGATPASDAAAASSGQAGSGGPHDAASPTDDASQGAATPEDFPFTATGPWRTKLPADTPLAPSSAAIVANIAKDVHDNYGTFGLNTDTFSAPIFTVPAGTPRQDWTFHDCQNKGGQPGAAFASVLQGVPTLPSMFVSKGTDQEIVIYDPASDSQWDFWVASVENGQGSACWGGVIHGVSTNPGIYEPPLGAVATGLPLLGFLVRVKELEAGVIHHAMNILTVRTRKDVVSWPANRTDGNTAGDDLLAEGQRVRLDPTFDVSTLPNAAERTIAKAMQDYGMILTDTSGAVVMQLEDPRRIMAEQNTTTNPYDALFEGRAGYAVLQEIPIDRLQVLPIDYGKDYMH